MRILVLGAPGSSNCITPLRRAGMQIVGFVMTKPKKRRTARRGRLTEALFWLARLWVILKFRVVHRIPVYQANTMQDPAFVRRLADLNPDLIVLFSFNLIIPEEIIKLPRFGCINVHPSLLPKYRGAHPHFWVLVKGETSTGVTVHYVDAGVDTGDIIIQDAVVGESGTRRSRRDGVTHFPRSRGGFVFPTDKRGGWLNRLGNACIRDRPAHSNCVCR